MSLLSQEQIRELADIILSAPIDVTAARGTMLQSINYNYRGLLPVHTLPALQIRSDLGQMNDVERLANGQVPLIIYLGNLSSLLSGLEQQKVIQTALDELTHRATGSPRVDAAALPETKEQIIHDNDMVPYGFMEKGYKAGASVVKLRVARYENGARKMRNANPVIYFGTAWLLTDSLIMTNHHVVNARNEGEPAASPEDFRIQALHTIVHFDFDGDGMAGSEVPIQSLEAWDPALDYAILRIPPSGRTPLRCLAGPLKLETGLMPVNIIQHPGGRSKSYAIRNNLVSRSTPSELRYFTDTEAGSSGSPVLDDRWQVVALHRASTYVRKVQFQGRDTAYVNVGTPIHTIFEDLRARYASIAAEIR
jgi:endonuclease G